MTVGGFGSGWAVNFLFAYIFVPLIVNFLLTPAFLIGIAKKRIKFSIWKRYLIANGFIYVFVVWIPYFVVLDVITKLENNAFSYKYIPSYGIGFGAMLQGLFFLIWLTNRFRRKELPDSYYKAWSVGFVLLYFLPLLIHIAIYMLIA
jgi:hypothetical protein